MSPVVHNQKPQPCSPGPLSAMLRRALRAPEPTGPGGATDRHLNTPRAAERQSPGRERDAGGPRSPPERQYLSHRRGSQTVLGPPSSRAHRRSGNVFVGVLWGTAEGACWVTDHTGLSVSGAGRMNQQMPTDLDAVSLRNRGSPLVSCRQPQGWWEDSRASKDAYKRGGGLAGRVTLQKWPRLLRRGGRSHRAGDSVQRAAWGCGTVNTMTSHKERTLLFS